MIIMMVVITNPQLWLRKVRVAEVDIFWAALKQTGKTDGLTRAVGLMWM